MTKNITPDAAESNTLEFDRDAAKALFELLARTGGIHLVAIVPDGPAHGWHFADEVEAALDWAEKQNVKLGRNVYFTANVVTDGLNKKPEKKDIVSVRFAQVDLDPPKDGGLFDIKALIEQLQGHKCPPSFIIHSGGGIQAFWAFDSRVDAKDQVELINRGIAATFGGDNCHNIDRLMRVTGTINYPNDAKKKRGRGVSQARWLTEDSGVAYAFADLKDAFPYTPPEKPERDVNVDLPDHIAPVDLGDLDPVPDKDLVEAVMEPKGDDRSADQFRAVVLMVQAGYSDLEIAGVILNEDHPVSAHAFDQQYTERSVERAIKTAREQHPPLESYLVELPAVAEDPPRVVFDRYLKGPKEGLAKATLPNLKKAVLTAGWMRHYPVEIAFDEFTAELGIRDYPDGAWRKMDDGEVAELRVALESHGFEPVGKEIMRDALVIAERNYHFDGAVEWIEGLQWDGVKRVHRLLPDYFSSEDSEYAAAVSRYWMTAHAGRVLVAGCQADMVPILVGDQGDGKTQGCKALVEEDHYVEIDLSHKDAELSRKMRGKLLGELGELRGLQGRTAEANKAWITSQFEEWTPKYKEYATKFPRRLVFVGTTNRDDFLGDETGERRYLPVRTGKIDLVGIRRDREQLWAEAAHLFRQNDDEVLWKDALELAKDQHADFKAEDSWAGEVSAWVERIETKLTNAEPEAQGDGGLQPIETEDTDPQVAWIGPKKAAGTGVEDGSDHLHIVSSEIVPRALHIPTKDSDRRHDNRIGSIMKALGFETTRGRIGGRRPRVWIRKIDRKTPNT